MNFFTALSSKARSGTTMRRLIQHMLSCGRVGGSASRMPVSACGGSLRLWRHVGHWVATRPTRRGLPPSGRPPWDLAEREQQIRAKAAELVSAGATSVRDESYGEHLGHIVMLDPEGNEFCVA
jgi:hypothetical protein